VTIAVTAALAQMQKKGLYHHYHRKEGVLYLFLERGTGLLKGKEVGEVKTTNER